MLVCTLGDLVLDVIVRLQQPLAPGGDATSQISLGAGGQAANVAAWAATVGASARLIGKRADDDAGHLASAKLPAAVDLVGPVVAGGRSGVVVSLVDTKGERTMCPDRGVSVLLEPDEIEPSWFQGCEWLHVSGYALFVEPIRSAALHAATLARSGGARVSVDLASWSGIRDVGVERFVADLMTLAPDAVFANEGEDSLVGGRFAGPEWIVKHGADGCSFGDDTWRAHPVEQVVDTTGAGDALAAGWLVGGPELALATAARCVQRAGSMP